MPLYTPPPTANTAAAHLLTRLLGLATCLTLSTPLVMAQLSQESFVSPPLQARPSALWTWMNAIVDHQQITLELEEMKTKGMRGGIIWDMGALSNPDNFIPDGPAFLSSESVASIHHAMDEAERLGLELGLSSASSWNAGGPWISSEDACQTLAWTTTEVEGDTTISMPLSMPEKAKPPTTILAVTAIPVKPGPIDPAQAIHLDDHVDPDGQLTWSAPQGKWKILTFVSTATGQQLMCPSPKSKGLMVDHLSARATRIHLEHVMERVLAGRDDFGPLKVMFLDSYEVKTPVDWTPAFVQAFTSAYGYDPLPWLPVLAGHTVASADLSNRFRHDYGRLVSDLVTENHFAEARRLVNRQGLQLLAEAGHGGHARFDPLKSLGASDIPMGEYWNHRKNWCTKEAASAANIYGKPLVNAEAMTGWQHWQDGPEMYKRLTDIAFCAGLNQITFHTFAHNPPEAGLPGYAYHAGEHFNVNLTWWDQARPMLDSLSRSCHLLQQGRFVADVCAYYGDGAPNLVPARRLTPTIKPQWTPDKCLHCGKEHPVDLSTLGENHDYDYLNREILVDQMEVHDGMLTLPNGMQYRLLVLPTETTIAPAVIDKIEQLVIAGATVVGPKPQRSNSMQGYPQCDDHVKAIANRIWGECDGIKVRSNRYGKGRVFWNVPITEVLDELNVAPDFRVDGIDNSGRKIDYIHRTTDREEIYFVCNTTDEPQAFLAHFRVSDGRVPFFWNPEDGSVTRCLHYETTTGTTRLPMNLDSASSMFVVFAEPGIDTDHVTGIGQTNKAGQNVFPTAEILQLGTDTLEMLVDEAGIYEVTTSTGMSGLINVNRQPFHQLIDGPWSLRFQQDRGAPEKITLPGLIDWTSHTDDAVRYFSGTATYEKAFTLPKAAASGRANGQRITLDLGTVNETAVVTINGKQAGTLWKPPYRIDITPHLITGTNTLSIAVTNTWNNRLVGDAQHDDDKDITRSNMSGRFHATSPLLPSGMLGPVTLSASKRIRVVLQNP